MKNRTILTLAGVLAILLAPHSYGQAVQGKLAQFKAKQQAYASSLQYFVSGNLTQGEATLEAGNMHHPGSPEWSIESGASLQRVASELQLRNHGSLALTVAQLALKRLAEAESAYTAKTPLKEQANERELQGIVYEYLLHDQTTALKYYSEALRIAPDYKPAAADIRRLGRQEFEMSKKPGRTS